MFIVPYFGQLRGRGTHGGWIMESIISPKKKTSIHSKKMSSMDLGFD
jgi:hypothetical protein